MYSAVGSDGPPNAQLVGSPGVWMNARVSPAGHGTGVPLQLRLDGTFVRGAVLRAETSAQIGLASVPFIGQIGTITVHGNAAAPVDTYRSLIGDSTP